ncbi:MAG: phospho-sugar mutase, partial [Flavobacteriales bacterium]
LAGTKVVDRTDYLLDDTGLPASNVLQFRLEDSSVITMRPSGTEPKIKFYFNVQTELHDASHIDAVQQLLEERIDAYVRALAI